MKQKLFAFFLFTTFYFLFAATAQAASLYISPSSGSFAVGANFTVTVHTDTQGADVNTAEASIAFSADTLELVKVTASPTFYLQAPGSPAKGSGTAYFGGGLPSPGYSGGSGVVGTMTFRPTREGPASVSITSGKVLLNDGAGTEALSATAGGRYTIIKASPQPPAEEAGIEGPGVSSLSHPDSNNWYEEQTAILSWSRPNGAYGFSFELSQDQQTVPDNVLDTTITTTKTYEGLNDGVWYFHIKSRGQQSGSAFGKTSHFRLQIDTEPPARFEIIPAEGMDLNNVGSELTIDFASDDANLDRYEIYLDGKLIDTVPHNPYTLKNLSVGPHTIKVVAMDKAGNKTEATLPIVVTRLAPAGFFAQSFTLPAYILILLNLLVVILLAVIIWLALRRRGSRDNLDEGISKLQKDVDKDLDKLKQQINRKLTRLLKKYGGDLSAEDLQTAEVIKEGISEAEEKIDTELVNLSEIKRQNKKSRQRPKDED